MEGRLASVLSVTAVLAALCLPKAAAGSEQERTTAPPALDLSCQDLDHFYDHNVWSQQEPGNHLFCPLDELSLYLLRSSSDFNLLWSKDCNPLNLSTQSHLHCTPTGLLISPSSACRLAMLGTTPARST